MGDIKDIAVKHLEDAKKTIETSFKYIVIVPVLILCSWLFVTEPIFNSAKFHYIKKTRYQNERSNILNDKVAFGSQHKELSRYKEKTSRQDTLIRAEIYKVIEENIPKPFNSILKIAALDNFGILIIELTIMIFIFYVFSLRRYILRKIAIALRILKSNGGFNVAHDYNISMPFWAAPIPNDSLNLNTDEFVSVVGFKSFRTSKSLIVFLTLFGLLFIQLRLCYISFITNSLLNWVSVLMLFGICFSIACIIIWFLPTKLDDTFNIEDSSKISTRRDFIILISTFTAGAAVSWFSSKIGATFIEKIKRPRFVQKKPTQKKSKILIVEQQAMQRISEKNYSEASQIIYDTLVNSKSNLLPYTRLFDLIILLCFKDQKIYQDKFDSVVKLAEESYISQLESRAKYWKSRNNKWKEVLADKNKTKAWNKQKI